MYKTTIPNKAHICRYFSLSRGSVDKYLAIKEPPKPQPRIRASILDDYKGRIIELMNEGKKGKDIFKEIKSEGFQGSVFALSLSRGAKRKAKRRTQKNNRKQGIKYTV